METPSIEPTQSIPTITPQAPPYKHWGPYQAACDEPCGRDFLYMDTIRPPLEWNQLFIQYSSTLNCIERELRTDADCKEFAENISAFASYCKPFSIVKEVSSLSEDCPYIAIPAIPYQHEPNETNPEVCYH